MAIQKKRWILRGTLVLILLPLLLFCGMLFFSKIASTPSGVHQHLMLPLMGAGYVKVAMPGGTGDAVRIPGLLDGPVVTMAAGQAWSARWFCEDRVHELRGKGTLHIACAGKSHSYALAAPAVQSAIVAMPDKLLILSDIEGNSAYLEAALHKLGVTGPDGRWTFGANRLVIAGDSVDRGRNVFAVLWRLHDLAAEAASAGGGVHVLLGNHEQYVLRGNASKAHAEHAFALEKLGGVERAFAADTVLGAWLRQQPVLVKVGRVLITHGGISARVAGQGLSIDQLNQAMQGYWRKQPVPAAELDAVLGEQGLTQYRGYLMPIDGKYGMASADDVTAALRAFDADTIVVGHSIVEQVSALYDKRVYAVDVNCDTAAPGALLFVGGVATVVDTGTPRALETGGGKGKGKEQLLTRPINLLAGADWRTLDHVVRRSYALSQLPFPY